MKKDYIIWTPAHKASNGVRVLYLLATELKNQGYNVYICSSPPYAEGYNYIEEISDEMKENAIVIYPEAAFGNPLKIKNVVRYVLYYPGINGGYKKYSSNETIFTHLPAFYPKAKVLTFPWLDETLFYDDNSPKTKNCYYINKGGKFREVKETEGLLEINSKFPETRKELADLLRSTEILYSYDNCSAINEEATLCGAKVKIITKTDIIDYKSTYKEEITTFEKQMAEFIEITQNLDYKKSKGKNKDFFEPIMINFFLKYLFYKYIFKNKEKMEKYYSRIEEY